MYWNQSGSENSVKVKSLITTYDVLKYGYVIFNITKDMV